MQATPIFESSKKGQQEADLLALVLAAPDADAPRLVLADWLTENGDPRGEFIQVQCSLKRPIHGPKGIVRGVFPTPRLELMRREQALYTRHVTEWLAPVRAALHDWTFQRGYLQHVTAGPAIVELAATLFASHPVRALELLGPVDYVAFAAVPLPHLRELWLRRQRIDATLLPTVLGPHLAGIESLNLTGNPLGPEGARVLAASPHLRSLKLLWLAGANLGDAGIATLATSPNLPNLETLWVPDNDAGTQGALALAASTSLRKLKEVDLGRRIDLSKEAKAALRERFGA